MGAKKKYSAETKLKALGLIADGTRELKDIGLELKVSYPTMLAWRKELESGIESGHLETIVNTDELVVHETVEMIKNNLAELPEEASIAISGELMDTLEGIDGYNVLSTKLQATAGKLVDKIDAAADTSDPMLIESLVDALTKIQNAFFNKNSTYVQVNNTAPTGQKVSQFQELAKP